MEKLDPNHFIGRKISNLWNVGSVRMLISGRPFAMHFGLDKDYEKYEGKIIIDGLVKDQIITDISDVKTLYKQNIKDRKTIYYEIERTITIKTESGKLTVTAKYEDIVQREADIPDHETILSADFSQAYLQLSKDYDITLCGWEEDEDKVQGYYDAFDELAEAGSVSEETISMLVLADHADPRHKHDTSGGSN